MATSFERVKAAWESPDRRGELNRVVEAMAAEGITRDELDEALGVLLDQVRTAGADDDTEEIINSVGDRLHGWCHESRHIKTIDPPGPAETHPAPPITGTTPPVHPSHG